MPAGGLTTRRSAGSDPRVRANRSGNAAPLHVLTGTATKLGRPWQLGMFNGDLYIVDDSVVGISPSSVILVFAATATGNTAPKRMINGQSTSLVSALGLFIYP